MKVAELLEARRENWRELSQLCMQMEGGNKRSLGPTAITRFAALYRAACADLALADAYQLPPNTVQYLHQLVGRAHNQLYLSRKFDYKAWGYELLHGIPQRLFHDNCLRLAFCLFWGVFLAAMVYGATSPQFAEEIVGKEQLNEMEKMYDRELSGRDINESGGMFGFYVLHNAGIGLKCFAAGLLFGVAGLFETVFNAAYLGTVFGHMTTVPQKVNFFTFVTAHGPFELTAIILGAAAGMRLGFSQVDTKGHSRGDSLRLAAKEAVPTACLCVILFILAAIIEGFISRAAIPYSMKAGIAVASSGIMMFYFVLLGYPQGKPSATR
jgi:uncharacterized membrane protein SpoIIM required for sporulation